MTLQITAFERGGYSAYGHGWYDPRCRAVIAQAQADEIVNIAARFWADINTVNFDTNGVETSEPAISGAQFTANLSNFQVGDNVRFDVMLTNGEMQHLSIVIAGAPSPIPLSTSGDYGTFA